MFSTIVLTENLSSFIDSFSNGLKKDSFLFCTGSLSYFAIWTVGLQDDGTAVETSKWFTYAYYVRGNNNNIPILPK